MFLDFDFKNQFPTPYKTVFHHCKHYIYDYNYLFFIFFPGKNRIDDDACIQTVSKVKEKCT